MLEENEIIDIIKKYVGYTDRSMTYQCLHEMNFHLVVKEIVKKSVANVNQQREVLRDKKVKCFDDFLEIYCEKRGSNKWLYRGSIWSYDYIIRTYQEIYKINQD